ncbi:MAG TPA: protein-disulfide reductase DsbD domain-containing protein [Rhodopila sp.]|nr:protein-disulfide reductase DsbD domain-containing protein [Rhodopila sp.]
MKWLLTLLLLLPLLSPHRAAAMESSTVSSPRAVASLVTDTDAIEPGKPFRVGLWLRLAEGWHTYWQNPGDAGVAPSLTLDLPPGGKATPIDWPTPRRVSEGPLMTYAYTGQVLLPVTVTASSGAIKAHAEYLVCKDICVPEQADFTLALPVGKPTPSAQATLFAAHDRAVPRVSPWTAHIAPDGTLFVQGPELSQSTVTDASFIPQQAGLIKDDAAQPLSVRRGGFTLALKPGSGFNAKQPLRGILTVRDRAGLLTDVTVTAEPGSAPGPAMPPLPRVLVFAFLGGLILNLMPCVFPVLAMKAVALAHGAHRGRQSGHAAAYAAGVLVTFMALAAALLAARAAGSAAGWGFQFSSPAFVAAIAWLLFAVGLNLSGVFQVGAGLTGAGTSLASRSGHVGSFFTGLLAVLVATPCTAPFMGVAVAAGLAAPPAVTMLVFAVMGLGLAAPYVALALLPGLRHVMPRAGRWMEVFKQALAFPMYGAAAWLVWVVSQEAGPSGVLITVAGLVLLGFAGWVFGASQAATTGVRRFGQAAALVALLMAVTVLPGIGTASQAADMAIATSDGAEPFSAAKLAALRAEGRPVFVDMTAAWCVTCLVNERVAIATDAVRHAFAAKKVAYLKGDWTRQDPAITKFLRQNGRDGVPLYVYYPADGGEPQILPQILTETTVLRTLGES